MPRTGLMTLRYRVCKGETGFHTVNFHIFANKIYRNIVYHFPGRLTKVITVGIYLYKLLHFGFESLWRLFK